MNTERYVIGMDGGGTKTAVVLLSLSENTPVRFTAGPMNYNGASSDTVEKSFRRIFHEVRQNHPLENCAYLCVGSAGAGNAETRARLERQIRKCGCTAPLLIVGDERAALAGAIDGPDGMILIAGTGSICCGRNKEGKDWRTGGRGHLIDDAGSGYAIGRDILSAVVRADDGRGGKTVLTELLREKAGLTCPEDIVRFVYSEKTAKSGIASLAKYLPDACGRGDSVALNIVGKSARDLAELPVPVAKKLGLTNGKLALCGSILQKDPFIRASFQKQLGEALPGVECVEARHDAACGAARMALDAYHKKNK